MTGQRMPTFKPRAYQTIEARQYIGNIPEARLTLEWAGAVSTADGFKIDTIDGWRTGVYGDWIVLDQRGNFVPWKKDLFEKTFTVDLQTAKDGDQCSGCDPEGKLDRHLKANTALLLTIIVLVFGVIWGLDNMITLESSDFNASTSTVLVQ